MANKRIKDLATTATTTASDDFMAVDGVTNGTRKLSAATPAFLTSVTTPSLTSPASTNLTLAGGAGNSSIILTPAGTGGVGIGTASPASKLHVAGGGNEIARFQSGNSGDNSYIALSNTSNSSVRATLGYNQANDSFTLGDASAVRMTMLQGGNVGIGTTTPLAALHVLSADSGQYGSTDRGQACLYTSDTQAINIGGVLQLGGKYSTTDATPISYGFVAGKKESSTNDNADGYLAFGTSLNSTSPYQFERMRISSLGTVSISATTAGASNAGALVVQGGISAGNTGSAASYFGGAVTVAGDITLSNAASTPTFTVKSSLLGATCKLVFGDGSNNDQNTLSSQGGTLTISRNATALLTLSNTTATFAGAVNVAPAGAVDAVVSLQSASGQAVGAHWKETSIADRGWLGYAAGSSNLVYRSAGYNSATGTLRLTIDGSTGAATFAGAVTSNGISFGNTASLARSFWYNSANGIIIQAGTGTSDDFALVNAAASANILTVPTGTLNIKVAGTVIAPAATTSLAPLRIPHGTAPTSPTDGDMWTTIAGLYIRINGATVGPLS